MNRSVLIRLVVGIVILMLLCSTLIFFKKYRDQQAEAILYMSKCDRIAIVNLDEVLLKSKRLQKENPSHDSIANSIDQYSYTESATLLGYKLKANGKKIELYDEQGNIVAVVVDGKRNWLRGVGDFEKIF